MFVEQTGSKECRLNLIEIESTVVVLVLIHHIRLLNINYE